MEKDFLNVNTVKNNVCGIKYYLFGGMIMTREEMEKLSAVEPYCFETDSEERWYEVGCIDGLKAADAEPNLESLWHDPSEEPQDNYIVLCDGLDNLQWVENCQHIDIYYANWQNYAEAFKVNRWAYVKDLLPKGGER